MLTAEGDPDKDAPFASFPAPAQSIRLSYPLSRTIEVVCFALPAHTTDKNTFIIGRMIMKSMLQHFATLALAATLLMPVGTVYSQAKNSDKSDKASESKDSGKSADDKKEDPKADSKTEDKKAADKDTKPDAKLTEIIKSSDTKSKAIKGKKVLVLPISGNIEERGSDMVLFGDQPESLKRYVDTMRRARLDDSIKSVVLRIGPNSLGVATAQELREAIAELQKRNKPVTAIIEDDSQASYLVAAAASEVVMPPSADLMLHGVSADSFFLRNLLSKVGVRVQVLHEGQYKSYGETFTNDDFTTPARQNMDEIVNDAFDQIKTMIAESRKISPEQAEAAINTGPINADKAKELRLIDKVAYADEIIAALKKDDLEILDSDDYKTPGSSSKSSSDVSLFSLLSMMQSSDSSDDSSSDLPHVAVLYAVGPITLGSDGGAGIGADSEIASQDFIETLDKIKNDDKIKAVILRVNSPGGSAFASDLIWKKIEELKKEKPVVASMGDVAASGGYYIAMGANRIVAQPGTITGSIGVVGGKPNLQGLYDKIGVNKTTISKGRYANLFSESTDFSPEEAASVQQMMKNTYDDFVNKAATGRKQTYDKLHEVAQGRVWMGARAKEVGLVDELGGLDKAILETKTLIKLKPDDKIRLIAYPKEQTLVDLLQKTFSSTSTVRSPDLGMSLFLDSLPLPAATNGVIRQAFAIGKMFNQERVLTVMPFALKLR